MQGLNKLHLLQLIFLMKIFLLSQETPLNYCGSIKIHQDSSYSSSLLGQMILCKSRKLYFRTSIGLFRISSIDYTNKLLTVSHTSSSSTSEFVSPLHLSAGFPPPSSPNSLLLFNCLNQSSMFLPCNNTQDQGLAEGFSTCSVIDDIRKLGTGFDPHEMNCTHYSRVYRNSEKFELGTRISFDVPDHVPNPCNECEKPDGNCGAGLRCVCHPKKCKDKVVSGGAVLKPGGKIGFCLVFFTMVMGIIRL
ncbi:hypothetical protein CDL12_06499 [Handroanthus impetiginosus]|uniref:Wall-associated receptor kinase C-terminal domain-containing protein n=1 Tax=Handroanthus impetiginosus TaxID=429701 RepID=A0A2G9HTG2_9LAMI|nr:hypothetical protein CDL12_06499 [Handroanthus impetiginosus]